jgi:precorrin-2 methylase
MTGKGSGRRKEDINKIRNNWDSVFGKKKKKQITEVTIEFTMEGNPTLYDMNNQVEKMLKENKITYSTVTKYINA